MITVPVTTTIYDEVKADSGIELCKKLYEVMQGAGIYPALTGGCLYKDGNRKDIDVLLYRNRQQSTFEIEDLEFLLKRAGLTDFNHYGFVTKAKWNGITVDLFNPETSRCDSDY